MKKSLIIIFLLTVAANTNAQVFDNLQNNNNLLSTATISVTIGGDFPATGSFPAYISERVDQFVTRLFLESQARSIRTTDDPKIIKEIDDKLNDYSLRGIKLKRSTGEELSVDLQRFRITGDFIYNPYLKNDDVLIFPANDITRNFFTVFAAFLNASSGKGHKVIGRTIPTFIPSFLAISMAPLAILAVVPYAAITSSASSVCISSASLSSSVIRWYFFTKCLL